MKSFGTALSTSARSFRPTTDPLKPASRGGGFTSTIDCLGVLPTHRTTLSSRPLISTLPNLTSTSNLPDLSILSVTPSNQVFTYRAQLTFGLQPGHEVNVAALFSKFTIHAAKILKDISLLPFDDEKGQQISSNEQFPDNKPIFYTTYYHNHCVLNHSTNRTDRIPQQ